MAEYVNVARCLASDNLTRYTSDMVDRLEHDWTRAFHVPHAVASSSGTAALHVALGALDLPPGSEVLLPCITDAGTVIPILQEGMTPVFVDSDPRTGLISVQAIQSRLTERTRCIFVVHLFGCPADMDAILELARPRGIRVIEDCAQAHGALYKGRYVGTMGDAGAFSLQGLKQVHCGEGGITIFQDPRLARRGALFSDKGWDRSGPDAGIVQRGLNYRMSALQAAVARARLPRLAALLAKRRGLIRVLSAELAEHPFLYPPPVPAGTDPAWWIAAMQVRSEVGPERVKELGAALRATGAPVADHYLARPLHHQPFLRQLLGDGFPEPCPGALEFLRRTLILPVHEGLSPQHMRLIAQAARSLAVGINVTGALTHDGVDPRLSPARQP